MQPPTIASLSEERLLPKLRAMRCEQIWHAVSFAPEYLEYRRAKLGWAQGKKTEQNSSLLVHVGKTCGSSVSRELARLSVPFSELHTFPVSEAMLQLHEQTVLLVRDPTDRIISAFNWHHPNATAFPSISYKNEFGSSLYKCFPSADAFADGIYRQDECGEIARSMLSQPVLGRHLAQGLCYYLGGVRRAFVRRPFTLVRTENCERDTRTAVAWLGMGGAAASVSLSSSMRSTTADLSSRVSSSGRANLRHFLTELGEYDLYAELQAAECRAAHWRDCVPAARHRHGTGVHWR